MALFVFFGRFFNELFMFFVGGLHCSYIGFLKVLCFWGFGGVCFERLGLRQVMKSIRPTSAPSKLRRQLRRQARDREVVVKCYNVAVERQTPLGVMLGGLS